MRHQHSSGLDTCRSSHSTPGSDVSTVKRTASFPATSPGAPQSERARLPPFTGLTFTILGLSNNYRERVRHHVTTLGGTLRDSVIDAARSDYCIVKLLYLSETRVATELNLVTVMWVEQCSLQQRLIDPESEVYFRPFKAKVPIDYFAPFVICTTGASGERRDYLEAVIKALGARYSANLDRRETTHLIVASQPPHNTPVMSPKEKKAREWGITIWKEWVLWEVAQTGKLPDQGHIANPKYRPLLRCGSSSGSCRLSENEFVSDSERGRFSPVQDNGEGRRAIVGKGISNENMRDDDGDRAPTMWRGMGKFAIEHPEKPDGRRRDFGRVTRVQNPDSPSQLPSTGDSQVLDSADVGLLSMSIEQYSEALRCAFAKKPPVKETPRLRHGSATLPARSRPRSPPTVGIVDPFLDGGKAVLMGQLDGRKAKLSRQLRR